MAEQAQDNFMRTLETGFWHGVARAYEGGLDIEEVITPEERKELLRLIQDAMNEVLTEIDDERLPRWNLRAVKHAAENLTTFEIAWRRERKSSSPASDKEGMKEYLTVFLKRSNCWSHP